MKKLLAILLVPLVAFAGVRRQVTLELVSDLTTYSPYDGERVTTLGVSAVGDAFMEWVWDSEATNTPSAFVKTNAVKSGRFLAITLAVPSATYGTNWSGSTEVPTKGDLYTIIESLGSGGGDVYTASNNVFTGSNDFQGDTTVSNLMITGTASAATLNVTNINATAVVGDGSGLTDLNGDEVTTGTVADARIASTLARDSEVAAGYQPLSANLTTLATLDAGSLTNLDGTQIQAATINSNSIDAATLTLLVGSGDVTGPASSTDTAVARFNGTGGKTLQDSGVLIDASDNVTIPGDLDVGGTASFDTLAVGTLTLTNVIDEAYIDSAIARDSEVAAAYQPLDADLTALAAGTAMSTAITNGASVGAPLSIVGSTNIAAELALKAPSASPTLTAPTLNDGVTFEQTTPSAYSAVTNWVADPTVSQYQYIATGTNVNFLHATNAAAGRQTVFLIGRNAAGTSTVTIPSALFAFNTNTVDVAENEFVAVSFYFYGGDNTNVIATVGNVYAR